MEATDSWVDPNLRELVGDNKHQNGSSTKRQTKRKAQQRADATPKRKQTGSATKGGGNDDVNDGGNSENDNQDDGFDDGQFVSLNPNRIILKRAAHVSDASDDDEE